MIFVDTNVFFYAQDDRLADKRARCRLWLIEIGRWQAGCANLQVANEFIHVTSRKMPHLDAEVIFRMADEILLWGDSGIRRQTVTKARALHLRTRYSWWDCVLLASALELGCLWFLSEDLRDGHEIEGLTIVDPFAHRPEQILTSR